jgi:hypothetical protein
MRGMTLPETFMKVRGFASSRREPPRPPVPTAYGRRNLFLRRMERRDVRISTTRKPTLWRVRS